MNVGVAVLWSKDPESFVRKSIGLVSRYGSAYLDARKLNSSAIDELMAIVRERQEYDLV